MPVAARRRSRAAMSDAITKPLTGTLYLVPAPLDFGCDEQTPLTQVLPDGTLRTAARLTHWICENAKSTRAYLKRIDALHALDRKSTRLNSSHSQISYAVFCLKKKKNSKRSRLPRRRRRLAPGTICRS